MYRRRPLVDGQAAACTKLSHIQLRPPHLLAASFSLGFLPPPIASDSIISVAFLMCVALGPWTPRSGACKVKCPLLQWPPLMPALPLYDGSKDYTAEKLLGSLSMSRAMSPGDGRCDKCYLDERYLC